MDLSQIDWSVVLIQFAVLLFSLSAHESAHAWTADCLGDYTARYQGRVSLNPLVHIDLIGTILFPLIGILSPGIPVIGWAKPTPVNPAHLRRPQRDQMLVAAAGPASNLLLGIAFLLILFGIKAARPEVLGELYGFRGRAAGAPVDLAAPIIMILYFGFVLNLVLAFFNMIPIPPLDGSKVLSGLLPYRAAQVYERYSQFGFILLYILMFKGLLGFIYTPVAYLRNLVLS